LDGLELKDEFRPTCVTAGPIIVVQSGNRIQIERIARQKDRWVEACVGRHGSRVIVVTDYVIIVVTDHVVIVIADHVVITDHVVIVITNYIVVIVRVMAVISVVMAVSVSVAATVPTVGCSFEFLGAGSVRIRVIIIGHAKRFFFGAVGA
jgi:hypothetical protein